MSATTRLQSQVPPARPDRRDPAELQREADAIRADMNRTLNALERKLSPRQILDRSLEYMQTNGGDVLQKIGATVNKNPLPLLLTSAGLIWLAASSRSSETHKRRFDGSSIAPRSGDFDPSSQSFQPTDSGSAGHGTMKDTMKEKAQDLKGRAHRTLDATRERATRTWGSTRERTQALGHDLNELVREQPLVSGAVALAIGAVIGAAFPATRYERNLVARARQAGSEMLEEVTSSPEPLTSTTAQQEPPLSH